MQLIDPVVIREKQERQRTRERREHATKRALAGLAWFGEHAFGNVTKYEGDGQGGAKAGTGVRQVDPAALIPSGSLGGSKAPKLIVASSTGGADMASYYIEAAYVEHRKAILERAIEMAQADLLANEVTERPDAQ